METETALPIANEAEASGQELAAPVETEGQETKPEEKEQKEDKHPLERELKRAQRRIDNLTRQKYELANEINSLRQLQTKPIESDNRQQQDDSEPLTLSKADLRKLVEEEAKKIAPTISEQQKEIEHRRGIVDRLAKSWGKERFDALASDLDEAFGGLVDSSKRPKPATDAIFEADDPAALIEYLADPENADEAEALGRMSAVRAGRAVAKLEQRLASKKAESKPEPSKAAEPIETVRGTGTVPLVPSDKLPIDQWVKLERERLKKLKGK